MAMIVAMTGVAAAERPRLLTIDVPPHAPVTETIAPYNVIFLNRCASGCTVKSGTTNSGATPDSSSIVSGTHTLTKFTFGDDAWNKVTACVRDTFESFNVQITDVDPGSTPHFEIMVGGAPTDLGFPTNVGGVSPNGCGDTYIPNALVFDFANVWSQSSTCGAACIEDICSTAAQEIGHSFGMDHSHNKADPMTYFPFIGRRYFQNSADQCGSDCTNGTGPMGNACSGTDNQVHTCCVNRGSTQNSYQTLLTLFGAGSPTPPVVAITAPLQGASVKAGFNVTATATDDSFVTKVEMRIDNTLITPVLMTTPYAFNAPTTLGDGPHTIEITAYDAHGTPGTKSITVNIGPPCTSADMCPNTTDACIGGRCVPGPGVDGGLGATCTANTDCGDGTCASDGTSQYCTTACTKGQCPNNFGCLPTTDGSDMGFCWPGYDDGTGGSGCNTGAGGSITSGLLFAALLVTRRRRK